LLNSHATWISRTVDRLIIKTSWSEVIDGIWVGAHASKRESAAILPRLREALALIRARDPYRYKWVLVHFDRILVVNMPARGQFVPALRRCVLDQEFVETDAIEAIASTIVHEATHGELFRRGVGYDEAIRQRVEDICTRQELAFARKLPDGEGIRARAALKFALPQDTWSGEATFERNVEWLRETGVPNWVLKALLSARGWRVRWALRGRDAPPSKE